MRYTGTRAYFEEFILLHQLNKSGFLLVSLAIFLPLVIFRKKIKWSKLDIPYAKTIVLLYGFFLTWILTTYQYNFLYNQWHWPDRLVLLASWVLMFLHPLFSVTLLIEAYTLLGQFNFGPGTFATAFYDPVIFFLVLFVAYLYLRLLDLKLSNAFLVNAAVLQTSFYLATGLRKAWLGEHPLEWALTAKLHFGFTSVDFIGWHWSFTEVFSESLFLFLKTFNRPLVIIIFLLELGIILLIVKRRICVFLLLSFSTFHVFTFVFLGVSFWPWMLTDLVLVVWIYFLPKSTTQNLFEIKNYPGYFLCTTFVLLLGLTAGNIAWWSVRSNYAFELSVKTSNGKNYRVDKTLLAPFHRKFSFIFSQDYLIDQIFLPSIVYNANTARVINKNLHTKEDFHQLKERFGIRRYNPDLTEKFISVVTRFLKNYKDNEAVKQRLFYRLTKLISAPVVDFHYIHPRSNDRDEIEGELEAFVIKFKEGFFDGKKNITVSKKVLKEIKF